MRGAECGPRRRASAQAKTAPLGAPALATIFGSIELVLHVHEALLADLERVRDEHWPFLAPLGDVFLKLAPRLTDYQMYVAKPKRA